MAAIIGTDSIFNRESEVFILIVRTNSATFELLAYSCYYSPDEH